MAANVNVMTAIKPPNLTPDQLTGLQVEVSARQNLLRQIIIGFERRYRCSLEELERKLENMEISEHPAWEDSIEWRNAVEQLERILLKTKKRQNSFFGGAPFAVLDEMAEMMINAR